MTEMLHRDAAVLLTELTISEVKPHSRLFLLTWQHLLYFASLRAGR